MGICCAYRFGLFCCCVGERLSPSDGFLVSGNIQLQGIDIYASASCSHYIFCLCFFSHGRCPWMKKWGPDAAVIIRFYVSLSIS